MTTATLTPHRPRRRPRRPRPPHPGRRLDLVFDFEKSHGAWVHDAERPGVPRLPDLLRLEPDRLQPPEDEGPGLPADPPPGGPAEAFALGRLQRRVRRVRGHLRPAGHAAVPAPRLLHRGRGARPTRTRSRWPSTGRCAATAPAGSPGEKGQQIVHFREAFHGRSGYTLSLTNTDPGRPTTSPSSPGRASRTPSCASPSRPRWSATWRRPKQRALDADRAGLRGPPGRHRGHHHRAHPGRGRGQPLPPGVPAGAGSGLAREHDVLLHRGRGADRHRHHREDVGARALRPHARRPRLRQEDAGLRLPGGPQGGRGAARTSSRSARASTPPGAATSWTWSASSASSRSSRRTGWWTTRAWWASTCCAGLRRVQAEHGGLMSNARGRGLMIAFDLPDARAAGQGPRRRLAGTACCC